MYGEATYGIGLAFQNFSSFLAVFRYGKFLITADAACKG